MRTAIAWRSVLVAAMAVLLQLPAHALDEVILTNGRRYLGTIVESTPERVVLSIDGGLVEFPRSIVESPPYFGPADGVDVASGGGEADPASPTTGVGPGDHPLPGVASALPRAGLFSWGDNVRQVPVRVTDRGRWQFLPCVSFWMGDFLQLSFYGDPTRPTAIEASLHRPEPDAWDQKKAVLEFVLSIVPGLAVDPRFDKLDVHGDSFAVGDLWFEVNDVDSPKSPDRWSVLLLHDPSLSTSRATYEELMAISEPAPEAVIDPAKPRSWQRGSWTPEQLEWLHEAPEASPMWQPGPESAGASDVPQPPPPQLWTSVGGERIYLRAFARERGRYVRSSVDWLRGMTVTTSSP